MLEGQPEMSSKQIVACSGSQERNLCPRKQFGGISHWAVEGPQVENVEEGSGGSDRATGQHQHVRGTGG